MNVSSVFDFEVWWVTVNQAELPPWLIFQCIANAFAIRLPQPVFVIEPPLRAVHVLARGDSGTGQQG
ncbi:MAG TPA: hypothetical protein VNY05_14655 [Candidatus Acidoferrales bacterium]|nr:hypothetical protein [Candidatus Acidoferrales bacterium]